MLRQMPGQFRQLRRVNFVGRRINQTHNQTFVRSPSDEAFQQPLADVISRSDSGRMSGVRATKRFSSHWLTLLVGQITDVLAPARAQVCTSSSVNPMALVLKPAFNAASRSNGPFSPKAAAVVRLAI